jgi:hypothetical protein
VHAPPVILGRVVEARELVWTREWVRNVPLNNRLVGPS